MTASLTGLPVLSRAPDPDAVGLLLNRIGRSDRAAFAELYDLFSARAFGLALRVARDRSLAEETLQEAFLEIWSKAAQFDPRRGTGTTWVMTLTHRRAVDGVRRAQSSTDRDYRAGFRDIPTDYDTVSEHIEQRDDAHRLHTALRGLTERQRSLLALAYYGGHSHTQIAALTGLPLGTVKSSIRDGTTALRRALTAQGPARSPAA